VGSRLATPRSRTSVAGRGRVCSEHGPRQQRRIARTGPTAVDGGLALCTEQTPFGVPTEGTRQPLWVEVMCQPTRAMAIIQERGDREVNHVAIIRHPVRWLHMSPSSFDP
jgi:hypothetical protein